MTRAIRSSSRWLLALVFMTTLFTIGKGSDPAHADGPFSTQPPYWLATPSGDVWAFGGPSYGNLKGVPLNRPIVGMSPTPSALGYWLVASDGGIFSFGDARFHGSTGAIALNMPIVGVTPTSTGQGYWMVASDGGIFSFGDARFFGSTGNIRLNQPIVGMAATPTNNGYWLFASDGGIFSFGDARFFGSTGNIRLNQPIVSMAPTATRGGYWLMAADGGVFSFGDAQFTGSGANTGHRYVKMVPASDNKGYWLVRNGGDSGTYGASAAGAKRPAMGAMFQLFGPGDVAVDYAMAQLDKGYIWGGNGPAGYDCSGLTSMSWRTAGTVIPRIANDEYNFGRSIGMTDLRTGDLLFWGPDRSNPRSIDHVAMYVGGGWAVESGGVSRPSRVALRSVPKTSGWMFPEGRRPAG